MIRTKKLLTTAVGGALSLGLSMPSAHANDVVFIPYVVKDTNRTTVVTLIGEGNPVSYGASIHLQYWTKSTTAANTAACEPNSSEMVFTDNDIVTFDTAGILGSGPLFGDTTNAAPLGTSISYAGPRHGYLLVRGTGNSWASRSAYWLEIDLANGGAHGDQGLSELNSDNLNNAVANTIMLGDDYVGNNDESRGVVFWPTSIASTVFTVTPLGTAMDTVENNQVVIQVTNDNNVQGAYDRNENGVDGTVPQTVRCVGRLTAAQLMPGVVSNAAWAATGGWGYLTNLGDGNNTGFQATDLDAIVYQVDTSSAAGAGKFMQNASRISSDSY